MVAAGLSAVFRPELIQHPLFGLVAFLQHRIEFRMRERGWHVHASLRISLGLRGCPPKFQGHLAALYALNAWPPTVANTGARRRLVASILCPPPYCIFAAIHYGIRDLTPLATHP